jgi:fumarate reductase subunit C
MSARRTYVRPMQGWWTRNPFFVRYMAREATAVIVYLYGLLLVWGIVDLANGEATFNGWLAWLESPIGIVFQVVSLLVFVYHTWSWFVIMPKTMPPVRVGGKRVSGPTITAAGIVAAIVLSLAVIVLARGLS